jgi:hypothetical protein
MPSGCKFSDQPSILHCSSGFTFKSLDATAASRDDVFGLSRIQHLLTNGSRSSRNCHFNNVSNAFIRLSGTVIVDHHDQGSEITLSVVTRFSLSEWKHRRIRSCGSSLSNRNSAGVRFFR